MSFFFFIFIPATKCVSSCCAKIYFYSQHILGVFLFPQIFLFLAHFRRLHPQSTFSSSPATFLFQSLMYLISLIAHNYCTNFSPAICQLETEPNTCYFALDHVFSKHTERDSVSKLSAVFSFCGALYHQPQYISSSLCSVFCKLYLVQ
jgi:hypothetical protein